MGKSNEGQTGEESQRWGGQAYDELGPRERAEIDAQREENRKRKRRKEIIDQYGPYLAPSLRSGIKQAETAIRRFQECIVKEQATITEFKGHLALSEMRDKQLEKEGLAPR